MTGDIHTFFAGDVTRTGRQTVRGEDDIDPVNGPSRATEFVGGAITSPGIVDRAASTEAQRVAAAAPADAAVLANNPHMAYSNQAYKGYCILEAGAGELDVRYQAVHEHRDPRLRGLHAAALPRRLRPAGGHRRGRSAAGVSLGGPALERLDVRVGQPDRGIGGHQQRRRVAPRRPRAARVVVGVVDPRQRALARVRLDRVELPMARCRCAFLRGEGEKRERIGQNERTEEVLVGLLLPSTAPDQVKGRGQSVQVLGKRCPKSGGRCPPRLAKTPVDACRTESRRARERRLCPRRAGVSGCCAWFTGRSLASRRSPVGQEGIRWCR